MEALLQQGRNAEAKVWLERPFDGPWNAVYARLQVEMLMRLGANREADTLRAAVNFHLKPLPVVVVEAVIAAPFMRHSQISPVRALRQRMSGVPSRSKSP